MSTAESSLPEPWVERIFATMRATYGAAFDRQWECPPGVDPVTHAQQLKAHWGRELRGYQQNPAAIGFALGNLPPHPPNLVEFRAACCRRPEPARPMLPQPKADPQKVAKIVGGMNRTMQTDPREWARRLQARHQRGEKLTGAQVAMYREALRLHNHEDEQ